MPPAAARVRRETRACRRPWRTASHGMQSVLSIRPWPRRPLTKVAERLSPGKCWSWAPLPRPPACPAPRRALAAGQHRTAGLREAVLHLSRVLISERWQVKKALDQAPRGASKQARPASKRQTQWLACCVLRPSPNPSCLELAGRTRECCRNSIGPGHCPAPPRPEQGGHPLGAVIGLFVHSLRNCTFFENSLSTAAQVYDVTMVKTKQRQWLFCSCPPGGRSVGCTGAGRPEGAVGRQLIWRVLQSRPKLAPLWRACTT